MTTLATYTRPQYYSGPTFEGWLVAPCARHRDSDLLDVSNWDVQIAALAALDDGQEHADSCGDMWPSVAVVRSRHFLVEWAEVCYIHPTNLGAVAAAEDMARRLADYPVLDEDAYSAAQADMADDMWHDWRVEERLLVCRACGVDIYSYLAVIGPDSVIPDEVRYRYSL